MNQGAIRQGNEGTMRVIDFSDFPVDDKFPQIEGKLFIADNIFTDDDDTTPHHRTYLTTRMGSPVQVSMSIIFICIEGSMKMKVNLKEYELTHNTIITILPGSFLEMISVADDFKGIVVAISLDFMNFGEDIKTGMALFQHTVDDPIFHQEDARMKESLQIFMMMKRKLLNKDFQYREQVARAYLDLFKYNGFQSFYEKQKSNPTRIPVTRRQELFRDFIKLVQENYRQERQILFYADKLCITPKYLSSVIHKTTGKYASEWIDEYVILDAKAQLKNGNTSVKEVCANLNFTSQSLFTKFFKKHTGKTPKVFQNS